jgi:NADPH:quinone reductase
VLPFDLMRLAALGSLFVTRPSLKDYTANRGGLEVRAGEVLQGAGQVLFR